MKNTHIIFFLFSVIFGCRAQSPIIDLYGNEDYGNVQNAYYKDINNFHQQYVGTWLYTNGTTSLKLVFIEKKQILTNYGTKSFYEDYLIGEYQYIENGIEKVNTLSNLNSNHNNMYDFNLLNVSCIWFPSTRPRCGECNTNEKRLRMGLNEPSRRSIKGLANSFVLRVFTEGNTQKLKVWFVDESMQGLIFDENDNPSTITNFSLPYGEYSLIKQ